MEHLRRCVYVTLTFILVFTFFWAINVQYVKASPGTIIIKEDGSIQQSSSQISSVGNVTYTLTVDTSDAIIVRRDNIILDGAGHKVQGTGVTFSKGIDLVYGKKNVTIQNMKIASFYYGVYVEIGGMNDRISGCNISENSWAGLYLDSSSNINVTGNTFTNNAVGITLSSSQNNRIIGNMFVGDGLWVFSSYGNIVDGNVVNSKPLVYLEKVSNRNVTDAGQVILVNCSNIRVENLNLSNTTVGLDMWGTVNSKAVNNTIANCANGVWLYGNASHNLITENFIANSGISGIYLAFSSNNNITANTVFNARYDGIVLDSTSDYNHVIGNNVANNSEYGISVVGSSNNIIYHNNFVNNTQQVHIAPSPGISNTWDNGYPSGGNYWDDYGGTDMNNDALGDTAYNIDANNIDNQPLTGMFNTFNAGTWDGTQYNVDIISKSILGNFNFNPYATSYPTLNFTVSGPTGTQGFCRVDIPRALMWTDNPSQWVIKVGDSPMPAGRIINTTSYTCLYFTYMHSTKTVQITSVHAVPEDIPGIILIALLTVTLALSIIYRKHKRS